MSEKEKLMSPIPNFIFCPKCGVKVGLVLDEAKSSVDFKEWGGFNAIGRGGCECGATFALLTKPMPQSPTFTLQFNIYAIQKQSTEKKTNTVTVREM